MHIKQTMRWYGSKDTTTLNDIKQAGCSGVVTALHHIPVGDIWTLEEISKTKKTIEEHGLEWAVVESLPVHEDIKKRSGDYQAFINNYKESLINLSQNNIKVITYNFMPLFDWIRTDLKYPTKTGALALRFEKLAFIAFDLFILRRPLAHKKYAIAEYIEAKKYYNSLDDKEINDLKNTCLQALPGSSDNFTVEQVLESLQEYKHLNTNILRTNLLLFLKEITPIADEYNIQLAIHPDDPPFSIFGLPRVMSSENDIAILLETITAKSNGLCFCSGSLAVRPENNLLQIIRRFGNKIHFLHLRNIELDCLGNFVESEHLAGNVNMYSIMKEVVLLMQKENRQIPMRPDHGHQMLYDINKKFYPGYSTIGRLKGLAELRGLEMGIRKSLIEQFPAISFHNTSD